VPGHPLPCRCPRKPSHLRQARKILDQNVSLLPGPDTPAPRLNAIALAHGAQPIARALVAWEKRLRGVPIIDVARDLGLSIEEAKVCLGQIHNIICEDIKDAIALARALDLERIDGLLATFYPRALAGDKAAALVVLKCLDRRAELCGTQPCPNRIGKGSGRHNVLLWLQNQLLGDAKIRNPGYQSKQ